MVLKVVTSFGTRYLYQRRLRAYSITSALETMWFILDAALGQRTEAAEELQNQLIGHVGVVALATGAAVRAGFAVKKSRLEICDAVPRT